MKAIVILFLSTLVLRESNSIAVSELVDIGYIAKDVVISLAKIWKLVDKNYDTFGNRFEGKLLRGVQNVNEKLNDLSERFEAQGTQTLMTVIQDLPHKMRLELKLNDLVDYLVRVHVIYRNMDRYLNSSDIEQHTLEDFAKSVTSHDPSSVMSLLERIHAFVVPIGAGLHSSDLINTLKELSEDFPADFFPGTEHLNALWLWQRTAAELRNIKALYGTFRRFQRQQSRPGRVPSPPQAWIDLAETILTDPTASVLDSLAKIHEHVVENKLFLQAWQEVEGDMRCDVQQSPQQMLYNLYNTIMLAELKGYAMVQFAYMQLKLYGKGNFKREALLAKERFQERDQATVKAVMLAMQNASRELWKCDPRKHIPGQTYVEITQLLQGYIQNEVDLNEEGTCRETCTEYSYTKSHSCYMNLWCRQQKKCEGRVVNCQYIDADMWVCPADNFSGKRYEYVEYENGRVLGRKMGCKQGTTKVDSWWRWLFWRCSYCFCLCDDPNEKSDRYFNLRSYVSDVANNKVVTGLRFVKKNRVIHLQIQQGELKSRAEIDNTTLSWVPLQEYHVTDKNVHNKLDFHMLTWEQRTLDLDDLVVEENHILTGVRFKVLGTHLNFEIYMTPFNFTTGKLIDPENRSVWKDNDNTDASFTPRTEVHLKKPDVPTRSTLPSVPDSKTDQYIKFTNTDMDRDAAQTTVPFVDAQPVTSLVPVPLSGAGIFHKGRDYFGGFVAPKIITYDYSKHMIEAK